MFLTYLSTAVFMAVIDFVWLYHRKAYHDEIIRSVQGTVPLVRLVPALLIYVLIPLAVMVFAVLPSSNFETAALRGAFLGLCMYGVYDLTNYATLSGWTLNMTMSDMAWGTVLCSLGAVCGYYFRNFVFRREYSMINLSWLKHFKYQYPQRQIEIN
jgi:uncharacterized membrane protein